MVQLFLSSRQRNHYSLLKQDCLIQFCLLFAKKLQAKRTQYCGLQNWWSCEKAAWKEWNYGTTCLVTFYLGVCFNLIGILWLSVVIYQKDKKIGYTPNQKHRWLYSTHYSAHIERCHTGIHNQFAVEFSAPQTTRFLTTTTKKIYPISIETWHYHFKHLTNINIFLEKMKAYHTCSE